ncbi:MAG: diguanylate cyclase, partial [Sulfurimonadaceae bacterium]|nr:diguanylate cyclase [Sulfurimonadaceae bacterium]
MSIRNKILLILLTLALSTHFIITTVYYFNSQRAIKKDALEKLEAMANVQHQRIKNLVLENREKLKLVNSRTQMRRSLQTYDETGEHASLEMVNRILSDAMRELQSIEDIFILDREGAFLTGVAKRDTTLNYGEHPLFIKGKKDHAVSVLHDADAPKSLEIIFSAPLELQGEFLGVIAMQVRMDALHEYMRDYSGLGKTGEVLMAFETAEKKMLFFTPLRFKSFPILIESGSDFAKPMQSALSRVDKTFEESLDYRGEPVIAISRYLEELDFGIVVKMDRTELLETSYELTILILELIIVLIVIVIGASLFLARMITKPVMDITEAAVLISHGNFHQRIHELSRDELGQLAHAVNEMADRLISTNKILEQKVQEKTADLQNANVQLEKIAQTDPLTGIANRRKFETFLKEEYRRCARNETAMSLLMVDIDFFKAVNDRLGHQRGDEYLQMVAEVLKRNIHRAGDLVARFGGEEFAIILGDTSEEPAKQLAEAIREDVYALQLENKGSGAAPYL